MTSLTKRQHEVFAFIANHIAQQGYAPSLDEIRMAQGFSSMATAHKHVEVLQAKGWITKARNTSRGIEIVSRGEPCPHCGQAMRVESSGLAEKTVAR
jgi:repressor LexA